MTTSINGTAIPDAVVRTLTGPSLSRNGELRSEMTGCTVDEWAVMTVEQRSEATRAGLARMLTAATSTGRARAALEGRTVAARLLDERDARRAKFRAQAALLLAE